VRIAAIDPGNVQSAIVVWCPGDPIDGPPRVMRHDTLDNSELLSDLRDVGADVLVIEMVASYGMAVGETVFETVFWIGRFFQKWCVRGDHATRMFRRDVKLNLCHNGGAKDTNIRQAILDRFGGKENAIGRKATPGPLYGIKGDEWAALAVALTYADKLKRPNADEPPF
jgi:hypothetical protein